MITSESVAFETQFRNFLFYEKVMFYSWDIQFVLNHSINSKIVTSWWALTLFTGRILEYIFSMVNHLVMKLDQQLDTVMSIIYLKYFAWFRALDPKSWHFLIYQPVTIN